MNFSVMLGGLIMAAPQLAAWSVAITVAVIMLRRGGGRAERFLLSGFNLFRGLVGLVGILCLVYAFWIKFRVKS